MKFLKYTILLFASLVWLAGVNPTFFDFLGKHHLMQDGYQFGDLFRLANLSAFKQPAEQCVMDEPPVRTNTSKKVNLYLIGDSFTAPERIDAKQYAADSFTYLHWDHQMPIKIDTSAINILLIECVERHFREKFATPREFIIQDSATNISTNQEKSFMQKLDNFFNSDAVEGRLDMLLFQNDLVLYLKQWKADFNYHVFGRIAKEVQLVNQGNAMVYKMDVNTPNITSSFTQLNDTEVDSMVMNIEKSRELATQAGMDHVLLSIIPNKVSVINPEYGQYNRLIERVYANPGLTIPRIDVLEDFRKMGTASYQKGDTHWGCQAQNHWLAKTNQLINQALTAH
jgi:hypothetical protein